MTIAPDARHIHAAEKAAARSPCAKSKRGAVLFEPGTGAPYGSGWNGPPLNTPCPGREVCGDRCNKLCLHAEARALRDASSGREGLPECHLLHVKLGADGHVTPGGPPSCWQCSREILDVGFVAGVWLYELPTVAEANAADVFHMDDPRHAELARWRYYTAEDFHRVTLRNAGLDQPVAAPTPAAAPIPMRLTCPACNALHIDEGEFASKPHHTHACQECGAVWRPAVVSTVGVRFLPGFRNGAP